MNIPPQSMYFYKGKWTMEIDTILVDTLWRLKQETGWLLKEFPSYFLLTAGQEIDEKEGVQFYERELSKRVETLHSRYLTFKDLLAQKGAWRDFTHKAVVAPEEVWQAMCKKNHMAGAYFYEEEPQYSKLACLFGLDDVKVEGDMKVIVISETTQTVSSDEPSCYELGDGNEEVTSPFVKTTTKAQRKLFVEKEEPADRESTTRFEKGRDLPKTPAVKPDGAGPSKRGLHASSCGSNSPIRW